MKYINQTVLTKIKQLPPLGIAAFISGIGALLLWATFDTVMTLIFPPSDEPVKSPNIVVVIAGIVFIVLNFPGLFITFILLYLYEVTCSLSTNNTGGMIDENIIFFLTFIMNTLFVIAFDSGKSKSKSWQRFGLITNSKTEQILYWSSRVRASVFSDGYTCAR